MPDVTVAQTYGRWALDAPPSGESSVREWVLAHLPEAIVDAHTHVTGPDTFRGFTKFGWTQRRSSFPQWTVRDSERVAGYLYGEPRVTRLRMPQPQAGFDHMAENAYVLAVEDRTNLPALCVLPDDLDYTLRQLTRSTWCAVKAYPHYTEPPLKSLGRFQTVSMRL